MSKSLTLAAIKALPVTGNYAADKHIFAAVHAFVCNSSNSYAQRKAALSYLSLTVMSMPTFDLAHLSPRAAVQAYLAAQ